LRKEVLVVEQKKMQPSFEVILPENFFSLRRTGSESEVFPLRLFLKSPLEDLKKFTE